MSVTIRDVAEAAKVSIGTVSRVLRGDSRVNADIVARVNSAVDALHYKPLRKRTGSNGDTSLKEKKVALLLIGMHQTLVNLPTVTKAIHGVEAALTKAGAQMFLAEAPRLDALPPVLAQRRLDGVIAKGAMQGSLGESMDPAFLQRLRQLPCVWFNGKPRGLPGDAVGPADRQAGEMAADYLIGLGHRRLAFLNPKPDHRLFQERQAAFVGRACQAAVEVRLFLGEPEAWQYPLRSVDSVAVVAELVDRMLAARPRPTAVFIPADNIAVMVYRALAERELRVGRDLGVVSCNHESSLIAGLYPALTTIDIHSEQIGRRAVDVMHWRMGDRDAAELDVTIRPSWVEGNSVAALKKP